ncbi:SIR2 family protein [Sinorhizobium meliloti]|uniref:SIR2 family protein n=1 Tax=Rhizobium meliloti TaxID=382 RepID=UPI000FDCAA4C|nr:SIR2 family protein [Sinorhizobium meliloti]RVI34227.1 SIR2 family protein [Sinorhizobium meliloti]
MTDQYELTSTFCAKPQQFAWFIGAGTSAVAGLPTAWDIIWDLKRRQYCREESQDISRQDVQVGAIRSRIQSYMLSKGYPAEGDPGEYTAYFQNIFGEDKERQRQYLTAVLSEDKVTLSVGNRVLGALLSTGRTRAVFTTNFDSVVERAVAEVSGRSLSAYHLEGAASANSAVSNEEFPFYCKLHGDFRYDSIKNLRSDLAAQNEDLSKALINAANRFGFIVSGYSGRDESVMNLLRSALSTPNPFPHGLFWTGMKKAPVLPPVERLLEDARDAGVNASYVEVETFDALMLRFWRNIEGKEPDIDAKVQKTRRASVSIPMPGPGRGQIVRMNALPITGMPGECQALTFKSPKEWSDLRTAASVNEGRLIFTKSDTIMCWGEEALIRGHFPDIASVSRQDISAKIADMGNHLYIKQFLEEAMCHALVRDRPLLTRTTKAGSYLIADAHSSDQSALEPLQKAVGKTSGRMAGVFAPVDDKHPQAEQVSWAEALRVSFQIVDGKNWLLLDPDIWVWPPRARPEAGTFLDKRRGDRYNNLYNEILDAWLSVLFGEHDRKTGFKISAYEGGTAIETPSFTIGARTAFTRRLAS